MIESRAIEETIGFAKSKRADELVNKIKERKLPGELENLIAEYEDKCGDRKRFLWKWVYTFTTERNPGIVLSVVPDEYTQELGELKTMLVLFVSIFDDLADLYKVEELFESGIGFQLGTPKKRIGTKKALEKKEIEFTTKLWDKIERKIKKLPRFREFKNIFRYDMKQVFNSFYHSILVNNNPFLLNLTESKIYGGHNMVLFPQTDIDIMSSPDFEVQDLPLLREIVWRSQYMARIGNWLTTWKREFKERDYSSGIFGHAVINGTISPESLHEEIKEKDIDKIESSGVRNHLLEEWEKKYQEIKEIAPKVRSVDIAAYLEGLEYGLKFHLISEGLK